MILLLKYIYLRISLCNYNHDRDFLVGVARLFRNDSLIADSGLKTALLLGAAVLQRHMITILILWQ